MSVKLTLPIFLLGFGAGVMTGMHYHDELQQFASNPRDQAKQQPEPQEKTEVVKKSNATTSFECPEPETVFQQQKNSASWEAKGLHWSMDYTGWAAPENIGFMQALIDEDDQTLKCYYHWNNPQEPGTKLWNTVKLNAGSFESPISHSLHWRKRGSSIICDMGIKACAFKLKTEKQD